MKLRIEITGSRVHNVGYRFYLMSLAMSHRIRRFEANNSDGLQGQIVEVLVESDAERVALFKKAVEVSHPDRAVISNISFEDYDGDVMPIGEYAQFCAAVQMNKAIPVLLDIADGVNRVNDNLGGKLDQVVEKQEVSINEIRSLHEDMSAYSGWRTRVEKDIQAIKERLGMV